MSQIQMQELKEWLKNPVTIQFKNYLSKKRIKLLNNVAYNYIRNEKFQNDIALSVICVFSISIFVSIIFYVVFNHKKSISSDNKLEYFVIYSFSHKNFFQIK